MPQCFFASDLHGKPSRYEKLFALIKKEKPGMVLLGGDLLSHGMSREIDFDDFFKDFLLASFLNLKEEMQADYPKVLLILGNDDARITEQDFKDAEQLGVWIYMHERRFEHNGFSFYGYAYIPPTPFRLKDWERYDVSRYADPGCIHPTEGFFTVEPEGDIEYQTIKNDLEKLVIDETLERAVFLFHSPPYQTKLDRAALDGMMIDHVPLDVHVGSIAIKRFLEERKPLLSLHGHIHESSGITGAWMDKIGNTISFNAAWDGPELSLISFDTNDPAGAERRIL
ncbi:MAG: metallophosphoesterase [Bacteroidales bacterium]|nr:metallophosphoesterase [Bacteroidales bacterium]